MAANEVLYAKRYVVSRRLVILVFVECVIVVGFGGIRHLGFTRGLVIRSEESVREDNDLVKIRSGASLLSSCFCCLEGRG